MPFPQISFAPGFTADFVSSQSEAEPFEQALEPGFPYPSPSPSVQVAVLQSFGQFAFVSPESHAPLLLQTFFTFTFPDVDWLLPDFAMK